MGDRLDLFQSARRPLSPLVPRCGRADDRTGSDASGTVTSRRVPLGATASGTRLLVAVIVACAACDKDPTSGTPIGTRTYRMGFSAIPPTTNQATAVASLEMW